MGRRRKARDEYEVRDIVDKQVVATPTGYEVRYKILWMGFSDDDFTWEPLEHLQCCQDKVKEFEERAPPLAPGLQSALLPLEPGPPPQERLPEGPREGAFESGDRVEEIKGVVMGRDGSIKFRVSWQRREGVRPLPSLVRKEDLRREDVLLLINFYESRILWDN